MFIASYFIIAQNRKQPRFPSSEEWMKEMWFIYIMVYCASMKHMDIFNAAGKWIELGNKVQDNYTIINRPKEAK